MARLEHLGMAYVGGKLPKWIYAVFQTCKAVALYKTEDLDAVRPLGLKHPLIKTFHKLVINQSRVELQDYLEPQQVALSPAGAAKLVMSVREQLEVRRDFICLKLDLKNAYNEISRTSIIEAFEAEPSLRHLASFYGVTLAPKMGLETGGKVFGRSEEGEGQGDPKASAGFCTGLQPSLVQLDAACRAGEGSAIAGADDIYAVGPSEVLLPAMTAFKDELWQRCHLQLQLDKSSLFCWEGDLPAGTPEHLQLAGEVVNGRFLRGFLCYGCPVGEDEYVTTMLKRIAEERLLRRCSPISRRCGQSFAPALLIALTTGANLSTQHCVNQLRHTWTSSSGWCSKQPSASRYPGGEGCWERRRTSPSRPQFLAWRSAALQSGW